MRIKERIVENSVINFRPVSINEWIVEFFGDLLPGFVYLSLALVTFVWPTWNLIDSTNGEPVTTMKNIKILCHIISDFPIVFHLFYFFSSFVIGQLCFRFDQADVDVASYKKIISSREVGWPLNNHWVVRETKNCLIVDRVDFPYYYLKDYLDFRGYKHLAKLIPWDGEDNKSMRSTLFINTLKMRICLTMPEKSSQLRRNEANIRLFSSIWHAMRLLIFLTITATYVGLLAIFFETKFTQKPPANYLVAPLMDVALLYTFWRTKIGIEKSFHFNRVREIFYVLETASFLSKNHPEILNNLPGPGSLQKIRSWFK